MTTFRFLAYLTPLLVGLGVPAALAFAQGKPAGRRVLAAVAVLGSVLLLLLLASFGESPRLLLPLVPLLASLGLLVAGLFLLCESLRAPREAGLVAAGLLTALLMGSVFAFGPIIKAGADAGASAAAIHGRISLVLAVNPFFVTAYSIFDVDLLVRPVFYRMGLADFQHATPHWAPTSAGYALVGAALAGLSFAARRLLR